MQRDAVRGGVAARRVRPTRLAAGRPARRASDAGEDLETVRAPRARSPLRELRYGFERVDHQVSAAGAGFCVAVAVDAPDDVLHLRFLDRDVGNRVALGDAPDQRLGGRACGRSGSARSAARRVRSRCRGARRRVAGLAQFHDQRAVRSVLVAQPSRSRRRRSPCRDRSARCAGRAARRRPDRGS